MVWIEYVAYILSFIISAGFSVIGILTSYQLFQVHKKPALQILLYQQIFLFSFFIYGIWGNIALHEIISDMGIRSELNQKLTFFIPVIGIPFLTVSWFMLIKFVYNINGLNFHKRFAFFFFTVIIVFVFILALLVHKEVIKISANPDRFIVQSILLMNFLVHLFLIPPFMKTKNKTILNEIGFYGKYFQWYFLSVIIYSGVLFCFDYFGFVSICISIIILFLSSIFIPVAIKINIYSSQEPDHAENLNFKGFCKMYDISKREAEIIWEICTGKTNKAISEKLFIALQTVKDHNHRIFNKTDVKTRIQLTNLVREKTGIQKF